MPGPKKLYKNEIEHANKIGNCEVGKMHISGFYDDPNDVLSIKEKHLDEFYAILGVPRAKKHLYSVTPEQFKKAITTFLGKRTPEELLPDNVNDIATAESQMTSIAEALLFDMLGNANPTKCMAGFLNPYSLRENKVEIADYIVESFTEVIRDMQRYPENENYSPFEKIFMDRVAGDGFQRTADRMEASLPQFDEAGHLDLEADFKSQNSKKNLTDQIWNYRTLYDFHQSRSRVWKFFHPFKYSAEENALKQIENSFTKRGITEQQINEMQTLDMSNNNVKNKASELADSIDKKQLEHRYEVAVENKKLEFGRECFENKQKDIDALLDGEFLPDNMMLGYQKTNAVALKDTCDMIGQELSELSQVAKSRANDGYTMNELYTGVPTHLINEYIERATLKLEQRGVPQKIIDDMKQGKYQEGSLDNYAATKAQNYGYNMTDTQWLGNRPMGDMNLASYHQELAPVDYNEIRQDAPQPQQQVVNQQLQQMFQVDLEDMGGPVNNNIVVNDENPELQNAPEAQNAPERN